MTDNESLETYDAMFAEGGPALAAEAEPEVRWLGELARVRLEPGDVVVLMCAEALSARAIESLRLALQKTLPDHRVLVLDRGLKIGVLGPAAV